MILNGRGKIYSDAAEINSGNVVEEVSKAASAHTAIQRQCRYLFNYYRGEQPILKKIKNVRPEINNKIVENVSKEIADFKTAFLSHEAIQYTLNASSDPTLSERIELLNNMMDSVDKSGVDSETFFNGAVCGTSYRYVKQSKEGDRVPFSIKTVSPERAFVVYSSDIDEEPLFGAYITHDTKLGNIYHVYTKTEYFKVAKNEILEREFYPFGEIPIIEYPANVFRLGSFEPCLSLLDGISQLDSDRLDAVDQHIQSMLVFYNCQLGEDEEGNKITSQYIREAGAVFLKSVGDNKADLKELVSTLDQTQTQTLKDDYYSSALRIAAMPSTSNGNTSDSSNNGAVLYKNGWKSAESAATNTEHMFIAPEKRMLKIVLTICRMTNTLDISPEDIDIKFPRRNLVDLTSKVSSFVALLNNDKVSPYDAYAVSEIFSDTVSAYNRGMKWYKENQSIMENALTEGDEG